MSKEGLLIFNLIVSIVSIVFSVWTAVKTHNIEERINSERNHNNTTSTRETPSSVFNIRKQRAFIQNNIRALVENTTNWNQLQLCLYERGLVSQSELETINSKPDQMSKFSYLYIHSGLTRRPSFFNGLREAFEETNNTIPLEIMQKFV